MSGARVVYSFPHGVAQRPVQGTGVRGAMTVGVPN